MRLDAHGIVYLGITGNFLESLMPRPCLCCLHETSAQGAATALLIHVPSFDVGDWGRLAPFSIVAETDLDKSGESSSTSLHHEGDTTLWGSKIGIDIVGMLLCCAS